MWRYVALALAVLLVWGIVIGIEAYLVSKMKQVCSQLNTSYLYHDSTSFYCFRMSSRGANITEVRWH